MTRRRRKKARRPARLKGTVAYGFRVATISAADKVQMIETAVANAKQAAADLPGQLERLVALVQTTNPIELITTLSGWALMQGVGNAGVAAGSMLPGIEQADVELLQGVMVMVPAEEWGQDYPNPELMAEVIELLPKVRNAFAIMRMVALAEKRAPDAAAAISLQERIRLHTQVVRNWGYFDQVMAISKALYAAVDAELEACVGVKATDIIRVFHALCEHREEIYTARLLRMREVTRERTIKRAVRAYYAAHPDLQGTAEEHVAILPADISRQQVLTMLLAHSDHVMSRCAVVDVDDMADRTGLTSEHIRKVMELTSLVPWAGLDGELLRLGLGNPIWDRPGIQIGAVSVAPAPQMFFSHIHRVMTRILREAGLEKKLEKCRADYLEAALAATFQRTYPTATIKTGKKWKWNGELYETDLTVVIDRVLIIAEAKSGKITPEALRGAPDRLKKHIVELVGAPAQQATRLEEVIRAAMAGDPDAIEVARRLEIDPQHLDTIVRVSVTLEDFSNIASLEGELKRAGWLDPEINLAPTLGLADLQTVFDLLEFPAIIIHYLRQRDRVQKEVTILGDELDCLGSFLADGLVVPQGRGEGRPLLQITGQSAVVDDYYLNRLAGNAAQKPRPRWSPWFTQLLQSLNDRARPGWTTVALAVLSGMDRGTTEGLEADMTELRASMIAAPDADVQNDSLVWVPSNANDDPVVFMLFARSQKATAHDRAQNLAALAIERTGRHRCVVIARMLEDWDQPYAFYMVLKASNVDDGDGSDAD